MIRSEGVPIAKEMIAVREYVRYVDFICSGSWREELAKDRRFNSVFIGILLSIVLSVGLLDDFEDTLDLLCINLTQLLERHDASPRFALGRSTVLVIDIVQHEPDAIGGARDHLVPLYLAYHSKSVMERTLASDYTGLILLVGKRLVHGFGGIDDKQEVIPVVVRILWVSGTKSRTRTSDTSRVSSSSAVSNESHEGPSL